MFSWYKYLIVSLFFPTSFFGVEIFFLIFACLYLFPKSDVKMINNPTASQCVSIDTLVIYLYMYNRRITIKSRPVWHGINKRVIIIIIIIIIIITIIMY